MLSAQKEFLEWLQRTCSEGENIVRADLDKAPRWYFEQPSSTYVREFYAKIDKWDMWHSKLVAGLRRRLNDADHIVREGDSRFASSRFLRFRVEAWRTAGAYLGDIDLSDRARYLATNGYVELRNRLQDIRLEPEWPAVLQTLLDSLRAFRDRIEHQLVDLVLAGEVRDLKLDGAVGKLAGLPYVNAALVKSEIATAETHVRDSKWRDASAAARRALEQPIDDAYGEAVKRQLVQPAITQREAQTRALAQAGFLDRATTRQAYASFSVLSGLGSHAGASLSEEEGEQAWQAARLAISLMASKLPP